MNTNKISQTACCGKEKERIVFACSGVSDLGELSDRVARKLRDNKVRNMKCLAIVGANIEKSITNFKTCEVLVIDGCPVDCGKKILDNAGFTDYQYVRLTDLGYIKGQTSPSDALVDKIYEQVKSLQS